jgi:hypothetical protein
MIEAPLSGAFSLSLVNPYCLSFIQNEKPLHGGKGFRQEKTQCVGLLHHQLLRLITAAVAYAYQVHAFSIVLQIQSKANEAIVSGRNGL